MASRVQDKVDIPVFPPAERMFLFNLKIAGESYSNISIKFPEKYKKSPPPTRQGLFNLVIIQYFSVNMMQILK